MAFGLQRYCKNLIKRRDGDFIFILEHDFFLLKTKTIQKKLYSLQLYAVFYYLCKR